MELNQRPGYQSTHLQTPDFWQRNKKYKMEERKHIQLTWWHNWMSTCRRMNINPYLSPCTKLKSKWIKDLKIKPIILNFIEERKKSTLECFSTGAPFLNITPVAQTQRAAINKWDLLKLRSFCKAKDTDNKTKRQPTEWEKIFACSQGYVFYYVHSSIVIARTWKQSKFPSIEEWIRKMWYLYTI